MWRKHTAIATVLITSITAIVLLLVGLSGLPANAAPDPGAPQLLLTEIIVTPTEGEFIEIYNPTNNVISLTNIYLTDATNMNIGHYYYNIVSGTNAGGAGSGGSDFHVRFPAGATIGPGEYQTIALSGSVSFSATYGLLPTYELPDDEETPDLVLDMVAALTNSIGSRAGLTNDGEVVILYYWDGVADLVTDLDYILWGDKAEAVDKTGVSLDGPDDDNTPSVYLTDTSISSQDILAANIPHVSGNSVQRRDLSEGAENKTGGNGADGHDETSEDLSHTWCEASPSPNAATNCSDTPTISKQAPAIVTTGERFIYTITVENNLGFSLSSLIISDIVPDNAIFAGSAGSKPGPDNVISWTIFSLATGYKIPVTYAVTASNSLTTIINTDYRIVATNFTTPTIGDPIRTLALPPGGQAIYLPFISNSSP